LHTGSTFHALTDCNTFSPEFAIRQPGDPRDSLPGMAASTGPILAAQTV